MEKTNAYKTYFIHSKIAFKRSSSDALTPFELAVSMVEQIPECLFNTNVLIPGSGFGTFALALIHKGWDPTKITMVEIDKGFAIVSQKAVDAKYGTTTVNQDFLEWNTEMKFDIVIGNPPYSLPKRQKKVSDGSKNLSLKFIEKAVSLLEDDGFICMLTPLNFLKPTDNKKPTKSFSVLNGVNLSSVTTGIGPKWFPGIGCSICMWTADKKDSKMTLNDEDWDLREIPFIVDLKGDQLKLFKRIWKHMKTGGERVTVKRVGDGGKTADEGWSLTERMNRRKLSETLWSKAPEREKLEQIHISLPPDEANKLFSQPHVQFFMRATDVEPTLYHNLLNNLHFGPMKLSAQEAALAMKGI